MRIDSSLPGPITLRINGDRQEVPAGATVKDLLEHLSLPQNRVAVERNREILLRGRFSQVTLEEGDRLEIVHFVGGG